MAFFDLNNLKDKVNDMDIKGKVTNLANSGVAQSKKLAEIATLKTDNMAEEDIIRRSYVELGKIYYNEMNAIATGDLAVCCEKITAAKAAIETNNTRLEEMKNRADVEDEVEITEEDIVDEDTDDDDIIVETKE